LAAVAIALVATVDHRHKRDVEFAAQEDAWFCAHGRPSSCSDFDEAAYEQRWEDRELVYRVSFFAVGGSGVLLAAIALWKRRATHSAELVDQIGDGVDDS
jgi:hypothetical protein